MSNYNIDQWTIVHLISGFLIGLVLDQFIQTTYILMFILHTIWEYFEYQLYIASSNDLYLETLDNKIYDTISFMVGYYIYRQIKSKLNCSYSNIDLYQFVLVRI